MTQYRLLVRCLACNREKDWPACRACCLVEDATRAVEGRSSPELERVKR